MKKSPLEISLRTDRSLTSSRISSFECEQRKGVNRMGYKLIIYFDDGTSTEDDDIFETVEEAEERAQEWGENWEAGKETLMLAHESYNDASIVDYEIEKV